MTSNSVMNSFFIPRLGSQNLCHGRYADSPASDRQRTRHLWHGISASYSGPGFSGMKFKAIATPDRAAFDQWVAKAKQSPNSMSDMAAFEKLAAPSEYNQVEYFSNVKPDLFADVINKFMAHGRGMDMTQPEGESTVHTKVWKAWT